MAVFRTAGGLHLWLQETPGFHPAIPHLGHGAYLLLHQFRGAAHLRFQHLRPGQVVELFELAGGAASMFEIERALQLLQHQEGRG